MITLSNGKKLLFLLASGMMGFDGRGPTFAHRIMYDLLKVVGLYNPTLFAIVTKTIALRPIKGPKKIKPLKNGWWNNYGLHGSGLTSFLKTYGPEIRKNDNIIVSIFAKTLGELYIFANSLRHILPNIAAVELNVSCPNIKKYLDTDLIIDMCWYWKEISQFPLILKIGKKNNYIKIAKKTEKIIQAIDINSMPTVDEWGTGAISGERAQFINWRILKQLADDTPTPLIGPSVWHYEDIERLFKMGANAVSFGSISMIHPRRPWGPILPTRYVKRYISGK
jgi:dihydroorotate dehydrogenase (NAD+) catalytic subunit